MLPHGKNKSEERQARMCTLVGAECARGARLPAAQIRREKGAFCSFAFYVETKPAIQYRPFWTCWTMDQHALGRKEE
jgi:hypothetical protein